MHWSNHENLGLNHSPTSARESQSKNTKHSFIFLGTLNLVALLKFRDVELASNKMTIQQSNGKW